MGIFRKMIARVAPSKKRGPGGMNPAIPSDGSIDVAAFRIPTRPPGQVIIIMAKIYNTP